MKVLLPSIFFLVLAAVEIVLERRRLEARAATVVTTQKARKRIVMLWELWLLLATVFAVGGAMHLTR